MSTVSPPTNMSISATQSMSRTLRVAVIGCGYWGPNLIRNFARCPSADLVAVCDMDEARLRETTAAYGSVATLTDTDELFGRSDIDAVAIATPVATHANLAVAALRAGKHVLVEKPLAGSVRDAETMVAVAREKGLTLMVDHTFVHSPPVQKIKQLIDAGELGEIYYVDSVRINLGLFQHDVNVVWDLAPHDLSILDYLVGQLPKSLSAFGTCHANDRDEIEDVAHLNLDFGQGLMGSFHVNWLSPVKIRHFMVGGSRKSIVYNDLEPTEKIKVYDRGVEIERTPEQRRGVLIGYRTGDVWSPHFDQTEPLQNMVTHFANCIAKCETPITDGEAGLRVVRILEAAQRSIKAQGGRITL
jgi:predicted dehydrogenase